MQDEGAARGATCFHPARSGTFDRCNGRIRPLYDNVEYASLRGNLPGLGTEVEGI